MSTRWKTLGLVKQEHFVSSASNVRQTITKDTKGGSGQDRDSPAITKTSTPSSGPSFLGTGFVWSPHRPTGFSMGQKKWTLRTTERGSYRDESVSSSLKYGALVCCHPHRKLLCEVTMKDSKTSANEEAAKQIRTAWDSSMGNTKEARRISHWDHKLWGRGLLGRGKTQNEFIKSKI